MHISMISDPDYDAYTHDACAHNGHDGCTHDSCMHDACTQDAGMYEAYIYDACVDDACKKWGRPDGRTNGRKEEFLEWDSTMIQCVAFH